MHKALLIIAWLGLLISGYLLITYVSPVPLYCGSNGCHDVQASVYAKQFGLPTPLYGVIYYFLIGALSLVWNKSVRNWTSWSLIIITGIGFVVSAYLTYLEAFVIKAWCNWCVGSALLATVAFVIACVHSGKTNIENGNQKTEISN